MKAPQHLLDWVNAQVTKTTGFDADKAVEAMVAVYKAADLMPPANFFVGTWDECKSQVCAIGVAGGGYDFDHVVEDKNRELRAWVGYRARPDNDQNSPSIELVEGWLRHTYYTVCFKEACFISTYPDRVTLQEGNSYLPEWTRPTGGKWVRGSSADVIAQVKARP